MLDRNVGCDMKSSVAWGIGRKDPGWSLELLCYAGKGGGLEDVRCLDSELGDINGYRECVLEEAYMLAVA